MKTLIRLAIAFVNFAIWAVVGLGIYALCSCSRVQYYPVESYKVDSIYVNKFERDSVYFRDSVYVHTKADTVFLNRVQYKYREIVLRDTVSLIQCDTTTVVREVPREFTKIETLKMNIGGGVLWAIPILILLFILYCKLKK